MNLYAKPFIFEGLFFIFTTMSKSVKKRVAVLTGAGISAESGIRTFRGQGGLWENHDIMEVASIQGWNKNPTLVQRFYNERRTSLADAKPNAGHLALKRLENTFNVTIITQNVDDLHERAGSSQIIHLHGELKKVRSLRNPEIVVDWGYKPLNMEDKAPDGSPMRPHIVWFGEEVPLMETAAEAVCMADILIVVGTSLQVYPAAGLLSIAPASVQKFLVDPEMPDNVSIRSLTYIKATAATGLPELVENLIQQNE